ncbi:hypothetical protein J8281_01685 [Aquimarina sp. U1-2]|uniref:hypothetical protein n=1 Tax=Aquimarina sp. U1-2 TaxID=2823141 RepID=UPI001AECFC2F|nr:hypothetical protein [Aquimarina sp. U1-2]MBP2830883.1 hypothetical protein [Aquimarina sp. U1-2]
MKKILFFAVLSFLTFEIQSTTVPLQNTIEVGDVITLGQPSTQGYQFIKFPKANFIIKKGGIPNYKALAGSNVTVTKIEKNEDGSTVVILQKENGTKFFNAITLVKADYDKALEHKEIILSKSK